MLQTSDVNTQWGKLIQRYGVDVIYALSPQAMIKIERPHRWLPERIGCTSILEKIDNFCDAQKGAG